MKMPISTSHRTENLLPLPKRISPESEQNGNRRRKWDSRHQTQRTHQRPHDLGCNKFEIDEIAIIPAPQ